MTITAFVASAARDGQTIFAAAVFLLGIPAALRIDFRGRWPLRIRNPSALALVAAYFVVQGLWLETREPVPTLFLFWIDAACLVVICAKRPETDHYRHGSSLVACLLWLERSKPDRFIIACFPLLWATYAFANADWWTCWALAGAQLLAASYEGISSYTFFTRRGPSAALTDEDERPPGGVEFALAGRYRGGG